MEAQPGGQQMIPQDIRDMINNGDVPEFAEIAAAFPHYDGISWNIRMAAQGSIPDAIEAFNMLLGPSGRWWIGYDNKATAQVGDSLPHSVISVTPGHALIIAALDAFIAQNSRMG
jgi:hypothetical protein